MAHRLGLGAVVRTVRNKLLEALPGGLDAEATGLSCWFLHDPDPWTGNRIPHGELRRLAACIRRHRVVEISVGHDPSVDVRPLGLVLKAGSWYLVCTESDGAGLIVRCIDELRSTRITTNAFDPPADLELEGFWRAYVDDPARAT